MQNQIEGTTTKSMVKTTGLALYELPEIFDKEKPDLVFTVEIGMKLCPQRLQQVI